MRSSHQTKLEKVTRENTELEREKADLENSLIAKGMKLKVKEEELDQSKKEAEMYKNSTVKLAKEKFKLEEEAEMYKNSTVKLAKEKFKLEEELIKSKKEKSELEVKMGKGTEEFKAELKNLEEEKRNLKKKYLILKVIFVCMHLLALISVDPFCHTLSFQFGMYSIVLVILYIWGQRYYLYIRMWTEVLPVHVWMEVPPVHV